jgi:hypothetical protein
MAPQDVDNNVHGNYWSNVDANIVNNAADAVSSTDKSPLSSPTSTAFNESMFSLPTIAATETVAPEHSEVSAFTIQLAAVFGGLLSRHSHRSSLS